MNARDKLKTFVSIACLCLVAAGVAPAISYAQVYKCIDDNGKTSYLQNPCPQNAKSAQITRTVASTGLPAGVISDNEDSVQILDIHPPPSSFLQRGQSHTFNMKLQYSLQSTDVAILSVSVAQIRENPAGCADRSGQLTDATQVEIKRGKRTVDVALTWSGDTGAATRGHIDMKGYLGFVLMFWREAGGGRGERIRLFEGYEGVCMRFGTDTPTAGVSQSTRAAAAVPPSVTAPIATPAIASVPAVASKPGTGSVPSAAPRMAPAAAPPTAKATTAKCTLNGQQIPCEELGKQIKGVLGWGIGALIAIAVVGIWATVFWILMIVHAAKNEIENKAMWIILMVFTGIIGTIIYYFVVKRKFAQPV